MPVFGERSRARLLTCDPRIERVLNRAILHFDFTVLEGHRGEEAQNEAHATGRSTKKWPDSRHNRSPSIAVDIAPWPIDWDDRERFTFLAGLIIGIARELDVPLFWGGDWDGDTEVADNGFDDMPHFELRELPAQRRT